MRMRPPSRCACVGSDGFLAAFVAVTGLLHCNCRGTGAEPGARAGGGGAPSASDVPRVCTSGGSGTRDPDVAAVCVSVCVAWKLQAPSWADSAARPSEPGETLLCLYPCSSDSSPDPASTAPPHPTPNAVGFGSLGILFLRSLLSLSGQT